MSRFSNLEFDHEPENDSRSEQNRHDSARHLTEAQTAFEQADFEQALRHFGKALESAGNTAQPWAGQVRALIELARYDEASRAFEEATFDKFDRVRHPQVTYAGMLQYDGDLKLPQRFLVAPPAINCPAGEMSRSLRLSPPVESVRRRVPFVANS